MYSVVSYMDKVTTDFVKALKKIQDEVGYILTHIKLIQQDVRTIKGRDGDERDSKEKSEEHSAHGAFASTQKNEDTYLAKQYALDKTRYRMEKRVARLTCWTLAVLALYTGLTGIIAWQSVKSTRATSASVVAEEQSVAAQKDAIIRQQRPWIGLDHVPVIWSKKYGAKLPLEVPVHGTNDVVTGVVVKNTGPSPALGLGLSIRVVKIVPDAPDSTNHYDQILKASCDVAELGPLRLSPDTVSGPTVFPSQIFTLWYPFQGLPFEDKLDDGDHFYYLGCIAYIDQFGDKPIHHTTFCFRSLQATYADIIAGRADARHALNDCNFGHKAD